MSRTTAPGSAASACRTAALSMAPWSGGRSPPIAVQCPRTSSKSNPSSARSSAVPFSVARVMGAATRSRATSATNGSSRSGRSVDRANAAFSRERSASGSGRLARRDRCAAALGRNRAAPTHAGGGGDEARETLAEGRYVVDPEARRQERGQHEASHRGGGGESCDRIQAQLREAGEAREQQCRESRDRGEHAEADGGPEMREPRRIARAIAALGLHEEIDRIVDRFSDEGRAEAEGDPVDRTEAERYGRDARERAADHGNEAEPERDRRTIDRQDQRRHDERARRREPPHA